MRDSSISRRRLGILVLAGTLALSSASCRVHRSFGPNTDPPIGMSMRLDFGTPQPIGVIARDDDGGVPSFPARSLDNIFDYPPLGNRFVIAVVGEARRVSADSITIRFREVLMGDSVPTRDTASYRWRKLRRPVLATLPRAAVRGEGSPISGKRSALLAGSVVLTLMLTGIALLAARDPLA